MARYFADNGFCSFHCTRDGLQQLQRYKPNSGRCPQCGHTIMAANLCTKCHVCAFCCKCRESDAQEVLP